MAKNPFRRRKRNPYLVPLLVVVAIGLAALGWKLLYSGPGDDSATAAATTPAATAEQRTVPANNETTLPAVNDDRTATPIDTNPVAPIDTNPVAPTQPVAVPTPVTPQQPAATLPSSTQSSITEVLAQAKELIASGKLVDARKLLNPIIAEGKAGAEDIRSAMQLQEEANRTLVFSPRVLPGDEFSEAYDVKPGEMLARIAPRNSITATLIQRVNNISDPRRLRAGQTIKLPKGPVHAVVTKHSFRMDLYFGAPGGEGSTYVCSFPVGLGQDDSTPTGKWLVAPGKKLVNPKYYSPRGGGEIEPDDPKNPLGEFWIGLTGTGGSAVGMLSYGIHGTIEPDSIGKMASLGCIRMRSDDIATVYDMLVEGKSTVIVKD